MGTCFVCFIAYIYVSCIFICIKYYIQAVYIIAVFRKISQVWLVYRAVTLLIATV